MKSTDYRFLITLCLAFSAANLGLTANLTEISMCNDRGIYHFDSNTCLITEKNARIRDVYDASDVKRVCRNHIGGEYSNETGDVVKVEKNMELFLREYLGFINIPRAAVRSSNTNFYSRDPECWSCFSKLSRDKQLVIMSTGQQSALEDICFIYRGPVVCQVSSNSPERIPPSCPQNVTVESVSDRGVTLSMEPGQIRSKVVLRFQAVKIICEGSSSSCTQPKDKSDDWFFLLKPMKYTAGGLLPNTHYTVHFDVANNNCSETVDIITKEAPLSCEALLAVKEYQEAKSDRIIIGLAVVLAACVCIIAALAFLYYRILRNEKSSSCLPHLKSLDCTNTKAADTIETTIVHRALQSSNKSGHNLNTSPSSSAMNNYKMDTAVPSRTAVNNLQAPNTAGSSLGNYTNVQEMSHAYDTTGKELDNHIYEI